MRKTGYGRLSAVVGLTRECADWITAHTAARCVPVIPNPVVWPLPAALPRVAPAAIVAPRRKVLLAVGRLNPVKNFCMLVEVFARLAGKHPDWDLVILGEGPERARIEAAIAGLGLDGRVYLPGLAGNVAEWHARASLFVLCSESEGFPNALAEALCHGLPAVSCDCNTGPRDIIRHDVDGLLTPAGDAAALAAGLDRVMGDDGLRRQFAARAVEARQRFGIERITAMWETLFEVLAGARQPASHGGRVPAEGSAGS
jgi:glycosyltransferase involved in cell wall biosynthesis